MACNKWVRPLLLHPVQFLHTKWPGNPVHPQETQYTPSPLPSSPYRNPRLLRHAIDQEAKEPAADDKKSATTSAIVKADSGSSKKDDEDFDLTASVLYSDDEVPFGPLGTFPENYSDLQAKVLRYEMKLYDTGQDPLGGACCLL